MTDNNLRENLQLNKVNCTGKKEREESTPLHKDEKNERINNELALITISILFYQRINASLRITFGLSGEYQKLISLLIFPLPAIENQLTVIHVNYSFIKRNCTMK